MSLNMKPVLFGAFIATALIQFAACQNKDKEGVQGRQAGGHGKPDAVQAKAAVAKASTVEIDGAKTPTDKEAAWKRLDMNILMQAHQVFAASLKIAFDDKTLAPESVFSESVRYMKMLVDENGNAKALSKTCDASKGKMLLVPIQTEQTAFTKGRTASQLKVATGYKLVQTGCQDDEIGSHGNEVMSISLNKSNSSLSLRFVPKSLIYGSSARLVKLSTDKADFAITCEARFLSDKSLETLTCQNLGQSKEAKDEDNQLEFVKFNYSKAANANMLLSFETLVYGRDLTTDTAKTCPVDVKVPQDSSVKGKAVFTCTKTGGEAEKFESEVENPGELSKVGLGKLDVSGAAVDPTAQTPNQDVKQQNNPADQPADPTKEQQADPTAGQQPEAKEPVVPSEPAAKSAAGLRDAGAAPVDANQDQE